VSSAIRSTNHDAAPIDCGQEAGGGRNSLQRQRGGCSEPIAFALSGRETTW
jgi:hypothetical protein